MTNIEYLCENEKELLIEAMSKSKSIVKRKDGKFLLCEDCTCEKCIANNANNCGPILEKMFEEEYKEPCPFENNELVEVSDDAINWHLRYFAYLDNENEYGNFVTYENGLTSADTNGTIHWIHCRKYGALGGLVKGDKE